QAKAIISTYPDCQLVQPPVSIGAVNLRGLQSLQLWQMDITKYLSFGETGNHDCHHFLQAFALLGVSQEVKTNNGPAYISQKLATFSKD
ncbi:hypothetical protein DV515_00005897, partial [Chloebia gouldiae]